MAKKSIREIAAEVVEEFEEREREKLAREEWEAKPARARGNEKPALSPEMLALIGGVADVGMTYTGLKRGVAGEDNPSLQGMTPGQTARSLAINLAQQRAVSAVLRKLIPKSRPVVDAIDANQGAQQAALAARWAELMTGDQTPEGGYTAYTDRFAREQMRKK